MLCCCPAPPPEDALQPSIPRNRPAASSSRFGGPQAHGHSLTVVAPIGAGPRARSPSGTPNMACHRRRGCRRPQQKGILALAFRLKSIPLPVERACSTVSTGDPYAYVQFCLADFRPLADCRRPCNELFISEGSFETYGVYNHDQLANRSIQEACLLGDLAFQAPDGSCRFRHSRFWAPLPAP